MSRKIKSHSEKEKALMLKVAKTKLALVALKSKRKMELGTLVCKCGLEKIDNVELEEFFRTFVGTRQ